MNRVSRPRSAALAATAVIAAFVASCATKAPSPAPEAARAPAVEAAPAPSAAPRKTAKERTVVTRTPVLVKWTSYYPDGLLDQYVSYKRADGLGAVLQEDTYDLSRTEPVQRVVYSYSGGRLAEETVYEAEGDVRSRKRLSYDSAGRVAAERTFDAAGAALSASAFAYDASGRMTEWRALDGDDAVQATVSYRWKGDVLASIAMADAAGAPTGTIDLEYGADGSLSRRYYRDAEGKVQKYEAYSYSGGELASVERRRADGELASMSVYEVGRLGERLSASDYDGSGAALGTVKYEYEVREDSRTEIYYE